MPRPLLTDDIIKEAKRNKKRLEQDLLQAKQDDTQLIKKFASEKTKLEKNQIYKSRRIESQKREERGKKITRSIIILAILLIVVMIIVFKF